MVYSYCRLLDGLEWLRLGMWGMTGDGVFFFFFFTIPNRNIWVSLVQHCIVLQFHIFFWFTLTAYRLVHALGHWH